MLLNDLYHIVPAAVMAFLLSCWTIHFLYYLRNINSIGKSALEIITPGLGIVAAVAVTFYLWGGGAVFSHYSYLAGAVFIYALTFYKNGILGNSKVLKLGIKFFAALFLMIGITSANATSFISDLDIEAVSWPVLSGSVFIVMISYGFDHLKEVDDLGGGVVIIITSILGIWFWVIGMFDMAIFSFVISSAFIGYLVTKSNTVKFDINRRSWRVMGFVIGFMVVEFLFTSTGFFGPAAWNGFNLALALLVVPVIIFGTKVMSKFRGEKTFRLKNSIPAVRYLLMAGLSDYQVSFLFWMMNIVVVGIAYTTMSMGAYAQAVLLFSSSMLILIGMKMVALVMIANRFGRISDKRLKKKLHWDRN